MQALFSARWYRIARLHPRLRGQVQLERQMQRGVAWFLLVDTASDTLRRLNRAAYQFVGRCDGTQTAQQIWDGLVAAAPEAAMTQDEAVDLLIALHDRGLIEFDVAPDVESIFRSRERRRRQRVSRGVNPLAFRISLGDPSRWLKPLRRLAPWLISTGGAMAWFFVVFGALLVAATHGSELSAYADKVLASPRYLFLAWAMYPFIKLVHEAAHAMVVQHYGGQVKQAGISLLMLTPVPFVNASAADGFRHRHQRALVSAAGVMAELAIAALALAVWLAVQPGAVRDVAFVAMFIGSLSTVLANGNPLMRFDGYYFFCDLLDLRNLAQRSARWWAQGLSLRLLGIAMPNPIETLPGERFWLVVYAPLSWCYRVALAIAFAMWIGGYSSALGFVLGGLMLASIFGRPMWQVLRYVRSPVDDAERGRALRRGGAALLLAALLLTVVPVPFATVAEGVVWLPDSAQVRAGTDGFIATLVATDGQRVRSGELIAVLQDESLLADRASRNSSVTELEVQLYAAMQGDAESVPALREKLAFAEADRARLDERIALLEVRAQADGVLVLPDQADLPGGYLAQGAVFAHLLNADPLLVRVALPQQEADLVRSRLRRIGVRFRDAPFGASFDAAPADAPADLRATRDGHLQRDLPGTTDRLPSAALGDRYGGRIATEGDDKDGLTSREPVVLMDVAVDAPRGTRVGGRATLRFDHGYMPLGTQAARKLQQLLLNRFNPDT